MSLFVFSCVFSYVCVLLAVAFFTFLERKGLGYMQSRKGPNKVGLVGLVQPISDAVKLLSKESVEPNVSNYALYYIMPVFSLVLAFFLWGLYPSFYSLDYYKWGALFFLCVSGLNVYGVLLAGWSSNSKYALLGSLRAIAQTISYEISMVFILLFPLFLYGTFSFVDVMEYQIFGWIGCLLGPIFFMWFVSCIAETNRAPFDFAEGESELVSGFNVEYSASGFVLIFLAEYANILVMSLFSVVLFLGGYCFMGLCSDLVLIFKTLLVSFVFIWVRGSYPRFRYDLLMSLTWKVFLPMSLCVLLVVLALSFLVFY